ncbi:ShlB/FhaC/HecB family hemolysin secretion/activation protein [Lysobacter sp.]|uniref:ShlB/FhaC/HecB family hemolysin secretion/activation protein n=1 Tax=Lysobacter sp. TaxID=72226 RepID=UPI002D33F3E7|nr:ShlB/FhaC/HecB family hemolysin secretion/activation protein [Lysobacter sp.]HZX78187.1 ShlB/FhaC/HecB family hemolysin secretion/activation protein [Lysobacter sp.]
MSEFERMRNATASPRRCAWLVALVAAATPALALAQDAPAADAPAPADAGDDRRVDINEYIVRGNTVLDGRSIERAVTPFLGPQRTMKDIEAARDALQAAYQQKGYQSVYVDIPGQQVSGGIVFLQVNETRVGRLRVVGAQYNSPTQLREQVPALREGAVPDFNSAQAQLTELNRTGKRQVVPLVREGMRPGTMDVDLKVEDQSPWRFSAAVNNDHSADTEDLRATLSVGHDNLWQKGHSASLTFFGAPQDLDQASVWSAAYVAPFRGTPWSLEGNAYTSDSNVVTTGDTNVLGKGHAVGLKLNYTVPDTGNWFHMFSFGVDFKDTEEALTLGGEGDTVPLEYAPLTFSYTGFRQSESDQFSLNASAVAGVRNFLGYGSDWSDFDRKRYQASPSFLVLKADANHTHTFDGGSQWYARLAGQTADSPLVSGEQFAAGGMYSVRGYLSAEAIGDFGVLGTLEWRTAPLTWWSRVLRDWRWYAFVDAARLGLREPLPEQDDRFSLASVGIGSNVKFGEHVFLRLDYALPLKEGPNTDNDEPNLHFNLGASF